MINDTYANIHSAVINMKILPTSNCTNAIDAQLGIAPSGPSAVLSAHTRQQSRVAHITWLADAGSLG